MIDRVTATIAIEIHGVALKPNRVGLDEAAQARMIKAVPVIVKAQRVDILPARKHEPIPVLADLLIMAIPVCDRRLTERIISVFFEPKIIRTQQELDVTHRVEMIVDVASRINLVTN